MNHVYFGNGFSGSHEIAVTNYTPADLKIPINLVWESCFVTSGRIQADKGS